MRKDRIKAGDEARIRFWDHTENSDDPAEYYLYGRVFKVTKSAITLDCWAHIELNCEHRDPKGDEIKTYSILRRCIVEIVKLSTRESASSGPTTMMSGSGKDPGG